MDDGELAERFRGGDFAALEAIYLKYKDRLYGFVLGIVGRAAAAEDIVQELFSRLFDKARTLESASSLKSFLFSCAHHLAIDTTRRLANRSVPLPQGDVLPLRSRDPHDQAEREEEIRRLQELLVELPVEQREVVLLKIYESMTFQEIAAIQGVPVGTVTSRYNYGIERIRRGLETAERKGAQT
jgi:RNA polymerase sigma-70 factor (ECF subfamily)